MGNGFNAAEELDPLFSVEDQEPGGQDRPVLGTRFFIVAGGGGLAE